MGSLFDFSRKGINKNGAVQKDLLSRKVAKKKNININNQQAYCELFAK